MRLEDWVLLIARCIAWPGTLIDGHLPEDRSTRVFAYLIATWVGWFVTFAILHESLCRLSAAVEIRVRYRGTANSHRAAERRVRILFTVWRIAVTSSHVVWVLGRVRFSLAPTEERSSLEEVRRPVSSQGWVAAGVWWLLELIGGFLRLSLAALRAPRFVLVTLTALWLALRAPGLSVIGRTTDDLQGFVSQVTLAQLITVGGVLALVTSFSWSTRFRGRIAWRRDGYREAYSKFEEAGLLARAASGSLYRIRTTVDGEILHDIASIVRKATGGRFTAYRGAVEQNTNDRLLPLTPGGQVRKDQDPVKLLTALTESPVVPLWEWRRASVRTESRPDSEVSNFADEVNQLARLFRDWDSPGTHQLVKLASPASREIIRDNMPLHPVFSDTVAWKKPRKESLEQNLAVVAHRLLKNPRTASEPSQTPDWAAATAEVRDAIQEEVDEWIAEYRDAYSGALWRTHALDWVSQELLKPRRPRGIRALVEHVSGRSA